MSETPCFTVFSGGRPPNLGGEIVTPKFRGYGLTGHVLMKLATFETPRNSLALGEKEQQNKTASRAIGIMT